MFFCWPLWAKWSFSCQAEEDVEQEKKDFICNAIEHSSSERATDYSWQDFVWECVSRTYTGSSSGGDKASGASFHLLSDGTSVSLQSNLNQPCWLPGNTWGEKEKINVCQVPRTPLRFSIWSLSLLINFKKCLRNLMSPCQHPLISLGWICLKAFPLWSAEFKKGLKSNFLHCGTSVFLLCLVGLKVKDFTREWWSKTHRSACQQAEWNNTFGGTSICSTSIWSTLQRHLTVRWLLLWEERE